MSEDHGYFSRTFRNYLVRHEDYRVFRSGVSSITSPKCLGEYLRKKPRHVAILGAGNGRESGRLTAAHPSCRILPIADRPMEDVITAIYTLIKQVHPGISGVAGWAIAGAVRSTLLVINSPLGDSMAEALRLRARCQLSPGAGPFDALIEVVEKHPMELIHLARANLGVSALGARAAARPLAQELHAPLALLEARLAETPAEQLRAAVEAGGLEIVASLCKQRSQFQLCRFEHLSSNPALSPAAVDLFVSWRADAFLGPEWAPFVEAGCLPRLSPGGSYMSDGVISSYSQEFHPTPFHSLIKAVGERGLATYLVHGGTKENDEPEALRPPVNELRGVVIAPEGELSLLPPALLATRVMTPDEVWANVPTRAQALWSLLVACARERYGEDALMHLDHVTPATRAALAEGGPELRNLRSDLEATQGGAQAASTTSVGRHLEKFLPKRPGTPRQGGHLAREYRALIVAIAGPTAGGKSWLAHAVCQRLREARWSAAHIGADNYYLPAEAIQPDATGGRDFDRRSSLDLGLLAADVEVAAHGGGFLARGAYDFVACQPTAGAYTPQVQLVVTEGLYAISALGHRADVALYVTAKRDVRIERRLARDVAERGKRREEVLDAMSRYVFPAEAEIEKQAAAADASLDSSDGAFDELLATAIKCVQARLFTPRR
jgi:uridine kinase